MKKLLASLFVLGLIITGTSAFAMNHSMSLEYARTLNRSASIADDSCFFNPAGTAFLKDGLYFGVGNQVIYRTQTITEKGVAGASGNAIGNLAAFDIPEDYEGIIFAPLFPSLGITFKMGPMAIFSHTGVYGGGGGGVYDKGLPALTNAVGGVVLYSQSVAGGGVLQDTSWDQKFEGTNFKIGTQLGGAYAINDMISVAAAGRMFYLMTTGVGSVRNINIVTDDSTPLDGGDANREALIGDVDVDFESSGLGWGAVVGVDVRPSKDFNVGIKFEYNLKMESTVKVNKMEGGVGIKPLLGNFAADDDKQIVTEPSELWIGFDYNVMPNLKVSTSLGYVFSSMVDIDDPDTDAEEKNEDTREYMDKIITGIAVEYKPITDLTVSVGYLYDGKDSDVGGQSELDWGTVTNYISCGATYSIMPEFDVTASFVYGIHSDEKAVNILGLEQDLVRDTVTVGLGVNYRMMMGGATETAPAADAAKAE